MCVVVCGVFRINGGKLMHNVCGGVGCFSNKRKKINQCTMCVVVCGVFRINGGKLMHNVWCASLCNQNLTMTSVCAVYKTTTKHLSNIDRTQKYTCLT